jgi:hypothetical protein
MRAWSDARYSWLLELLCGALVALISPAGAIAVDAASFGVSAICLALMQTQGSPTPWKNRNFRHDLSEGWTAFSSRHWLVVVVIGEVLYALFVMPSIYAVGPAIADEKLGGASSWAAVVSGFGIGFLIGGLTAMKLRPQRPLILAYILCIPFAFFFIALSRWTSGRVMAWSFLPPVVAATIEIARGNVPGTLTLVGMAIAIIGVAIVNHPKAESTDDHPVATIDPDAEYAVEHPS